MPRNSELTAHLSVMRQNVASAPRPAASSSSSERVHVSAVVLVLVRATISPHATALVGANAAISKSMCLKKAASVAVATLGRGGSRLTAGSNPFVWSEFSAPNICTTATPMMQGSMSVKEAPSRVSSMRLAWVSST